MSNPYRLEDEVLPLLQKTEFLPPLLARLTLATAFLVSGTGKFRHMSKDVAYFKQLGIRAPRIMAPLVATTEVTCGSLLGMGLLTRAAALSLMPIMVVAILTARRKEASSFSELTGVYEFSYLILLSYLVIYGGGELALGALARMDHVPRIKSYLAERIQKTRPARSLQIGHVA
jgi:uncharacterized membrane protein YphA (DoxX/SURF4 family)